jgi:hypothetical protein
MTLIETYGNQHLRNFDATHDLTKASTTPTNHKEAQTIPLATLSMKWLRS